MPYCSLSSSDLSVKLSLTLVYRREATKIIYLTSIIASESKLRYLNDCYVYNWYNMKLRVMHFVSIEAKCRVGKHIIPQQNEVIVSVWKMRKHYCELNPQLTTSHTSRTWQGRLILVMHHCTIKMTYTCSSSLCHLQSISVRLRPSSHISVWRSIVPCVSRYTFHLITHTVGSFSQLRGANRGRFWSRQRFWW